MIRTSCWRDHRCDDREEVSLRRKGCSFGDKLILASRNVTVEESGSGKIELEAHGRYVFKVRRRLSCAWVLDSERTKEASGVGNPQPSPLTAGQTQWPRPIDLPERQSLRRKGGVAAQVVKRIVRVDNPIVAQKGMVLGENMCQFERSQTQTLGKGAHLQIPSNSRQINDGFNPHSSQVGGIAYSGEQHL